MVILHEFKTKTRFPEEAGVEDLGKKSAVVAVPGWEEDFYRRDFGLNHFHARWQVYGMGAELANRVSGSFSTMPSFSFDLSGPITSLFKA